MVSFTHVPFPTRVILKFFVFYAYQWNDLIISEMYIFFTTMYLANGAVGMTQQFKETFHGVYKIRLCRAINTEIVLRRLGLAVECQNAVGENSKNPTISN